mgnify:CR=1 FL=1
MDIEMILSFIFVIVLFSILMGTIGGIWKRKIRFKEKELEFRSRNTTEEGGITRERAQQIEERLRNLERIVTEGNYGLAKEIEDLRSEATSALPKKEVV